MEEKKYICVKTGMVITEEGLQEIFSMHSFVIFNERDYENWKIEKIRCGIIKEV